MGKRAATKFADLYHSNFEPLDSSTPATELQTISSAASDDEPSFIGHPHDTEVLPDSDEEVPQIDTTEVMQTSDPPPIETPEVPVETSKVPVETPEVPVETPEVPVETPEISPPVETPEISPPVETPEVSPPVKTHEVPVETPEISPPVDIPNS
jgi:hypothetical protein